MVGDVVIAVIAAVIVALVVVPFIIGLVRGPKAESAEPSRGTRDESMRPLRRVAGLYGRYLFLNIFYLGVAVWYASRGFYGSPGTAGSICVDSGFPNYGTTHGETALPGAALRAGGDISACALHPSVGQLGLYLLTRLPNIALWGVMLLLIWRLIALAGRSGPFTVDAARVLQQLGWVVIAGSAVSGALSHLGADLLTRMLMTPATFDINGTLIDVLVFGPVKALFPVPVLAGAALLTFGRMTRAAALMDEELKATV